jgi:hypothetical protein
MYKRKIRNLYRRNVYLQRGHRIVAAIAAGWIGVSIYAAGFLWDVLLATSKSGTLLLRRDQGEMSVFWDSLSRWL